ncbi:hypothetical protein [Methylorubrum thiocyanatum]|uniref:hypothetical protein n=1 Tax=Methylorubrum thiocyanatum TaxID=47958 RepID=UPI00398C64D2
MAPAAVSGLALPEAGASGLTALLPVAPGLAGASGLASAGLASADLAPPVPGGTALLPVAPGFNGAVPPGVPAAAAGEPDPVDGLPASAGLPDGDPAVADAALEGGTALLPVAPGLVEASGLAETSDLVSCGREAVPGALLPDSALLPVGPGLAGSVRDGSEAAGPDLTGSTFVAEAAADGSGGLPAALASAGRD